MGNMRFVLTFKLHRNTYEFSLNTQLKDIDDFKTQKDFNQLDFKTNDILKIYLYEKFNHQLGHKPSIKNKKI